MNLNHRLKLVGILHETFAKVGERDEVQGVSDTGGDLCKKAKIQPVTKFSEIF